MNLGKRTCWTIFCGLPLVLAGCSGGGSTGTGTIDSVVQDLTLDPNGTTTVITFSERPGSMFPANITADGGQTAQSLSTDGSTTLVVWDDRVTPANEITVTGAAFIADSSSPVTTSDDSVPTFTITDTGMVAGLGGDTMEVTFRGPRVVESDAEDLTSWTLQVDETTLDLTGSTFDLDVASQVMQVTLGAGANLHSSFTLSAADLVSVADVAVEDTPVAGVASGDVSFPSLGSVVQNLTEDEFGRTIDFTFDEAMDPVFSESVSAFWVPLPNVSTTVTQPTPGLLRVTFASPVIPGVDSVTLSNMMDVHGNPGPSGAQVVTQPSPAPNAFDADAAVTVANVGGDYVQATFDQAFQVASAEDETNWTLVVDGNGINLGDQVLSYDLLGKTMRFDLDFDMVNGTAYALTAVNILEVDGESFSAATAGTVDGDVTAPLVTTVLQNQVQDPTGQTLDVVFAEDLEETAAELVGNWTVAGLVVDSATLLGTSHVVRLTLSGGAAVPGTHTLDVDNMEDLAGNVMGAAQIGLAITSTDTTAPNITTATATAIAGADNDTIVVWFDEDMVASEVETATHWTVESPVGTGLDTAGATVLYSSARRRAKLTFDAGNGVFFKGGDDFSVTLATMTDVADNAITSTVLTGDVNYETDRPWADAAWADGAVDTRVVVRFSEHMDYLEDLYDPTTNVDGTRYVVRDDLGAVRGRPSTATALDSGLGAQLDFGFVITGTDTIDVMGATDLIGNCMFPTLSMPLAAEDTNDPGLALPGSPLIAVSGERNDTITVTFDRNVSPWGVTDYRNYGVSTGGNSLDLSTADFAFDGDDTVLITMRGSRAESLQGASNYDVSVDNLYSEQGIPMAARKTVLAVAVAGDIAVGPTVGAGDVKPDQADANRLLVTADEALDRALAEDETRWNYNSGTAPTLAERIGPRTVRLTFATPPVAGNSLGYNVVDLAGNAGGALSRNVQVAETDAPVLVTVSGTAVPGVGGDYVTVIFDEPVDLASGLDVTNYTATNGGIPIALAGGDSWADSTNNSVNFFLASGVELNSSMPVEVTVNSVSDPVGNGIAAPVTLAGVVGGDTVTPPGVISAYTNFREDESGLLIDVWFDEAPDPTFTTNQFNWSITAGSGQVVLGVIELEGDVYRVVVSSSLGFGEELELAAGLPDLAGNTAGGAITVTVTE